MVMAAVSMIIMVVLVTCAMLNNQKFNVQIVATNSFWYDKLTKASNDNANMNSLKLAISADEINKAKDPLFYF